MSNFIQCIFNFVHYLRQRGPIRRLLGQQGLKCEMQGLLNLEFLLPSVSIGLNSSSSVLVLILRVICTEALKEWLCMLWHSWKMGHLVDWRHVVCWLASLALGYSWWALQKRSCSLWKILPWSAWSCNKNLPRLAIKCQRAIRNDL